MEAVTAVCKLAARRRRGCTDVKSPAAGAVEAVAVGDILASSHRATVKRKVTVSPPFRACASEIDRDRGR